MSREDALRSRARLAEELGETYEEHDFGAPTLLASQPWRPLSPEDLAELRRMFPPPAKEGSR